MKNMKIMLYKSNQKRDGSYPVCLRISKDGKRKYISLGLSAQGAQWNDDADRFKKDKRVCPNYERDNLFLNSCDVADLFRQFLGSVCGKGTKLVANSI